METRKPPAPEADGVIEGRNAVIEALRAGTDKTRRVLSYLSSLPFLLP